MRKSESRSRLRRIVRVKSSRVTGRHLGLEDLESRALLAADAVLDWNWIALEAVKNDTLLAAPDQGGPTRDANALATVHIALYDAVNAIDGGHAPYLHHSRAPATASVEAAVAAAAHATLTRLWPQQAASFDVAFQSALDAIPDGLAEDQGIALGNETASRILLARENDGSHAEMTHELISEPGHHQYDPFHPDQGVLTPKWGKVKPFAMDSGEQFRVPPPPALESVEYAAALQEVLVSGAIDAETSDRDNNGLPDRTPEQTEIGYFWAYDGSRGLGTPPRLYNQIARTVAEQQGNTLVENARLFALLNIALADAGIASWESKYVYDFWRPVVAIRNADLDGNATTTADPDWAPLGAPASNSNDPSADFTPPFPAYVSGHATFGAAAFRTLELFYGTDDISFSFQSDEFNGVTQDARGNVRPTLTRNFNSFSQAALENAISRIYLGIHWRFDAEQGLAQGAAVADHVFSSQLVAQPRAHDAVLDWNWIALEAIRKDSLRAIKDQGGPTKDSLALGVVHTAIYDAVNEIDGSHTRYLYKVKGAKGADLDAAVASAAHAVLVDLFPHQQADLDAELDVYLAAIPDSHAKDHGVMVGLGAADRLLAARENDGQDLDMSHEPTPGLGHHQVDPLHPDQGFLTPKWGKIQPFSMNTSEDFNMPAPPPLESAEYAAAYNEVLVAGALDAETADRDGNGLPDRTPEQTAIGQFWAYDGSRNLGTPPRFFNQIVRTIAQEQGNTVIENARLFALVNVALADAGIASWNTKYVHDFWRPVVAIRSGDLDGNPATAAEADWRPLGAPASNSGDPNGDFTPPFPAYTSGHATFGGAVFRILELFYGRDDIAFAVQSDELNGVTADSHGHVRVAAMRHFDSFRRAAQENAQSRIYLGIHWQFDAQQGIDQGQAVADHVFAHEFLPRLVFQNEELASDVNGDSRLTLMDLVTQVQQLRHYFATGQMEPDFSGYCDVNGDDRFSVSDLLAVVQAILASADNSSGELALSSPESESSSAPSAGLPSIDPGAAGGQIVPATLCLAPPTDELDKANAGLTGNVAERHHHCHRVSDDKSTCDALRDISSDERREDDDELDLLADSQDV